MTFDPETAARLLVAALVLLTFVGLFVGERLNRTMRVWVDACCVAAVMLALWVAR